jgi:hypothetical protein
MWRRWIAVATLATVLGAQNAGAAAEPRPSDPLPTRQQSALHDFTSCVSGAGAGDVLLLIDESGSLRTTDPDGARVTAARHLIGQWAQLEGITLNISVGTFGGAFDEVLPFTTLTGDRAGEIDAAVQSLETRDAGDWTDYWTALDEARKSLSEQAHSSGGTCQAIVWFSDGELDVTAEKVNPDDSPVLENGEPVPSPYVDSVDVERSAATEAALEDLCRAGGVADQVRSAGIVTFGIGLAAAGTSESDFDAMRAIATGGGGDQPCGDITTPSPGQFFGVSDLDTLIEAFHRVGQTDGEPTEETLAVCQGELCAEQHKFVLDTSVQSVHIFARTDVQAADIYVAPPTGEAIKIDWGELNESRATSIGEVDIVTTALTARTITFDLRAPTGAEPWTGQWGLAFVDPSSTTPEGQSRTLMWIRGGLRPTVEIAPGEDPAEIRSGELAHVRFSLEDTDGNTVDPESLLGEMRVDLSVLPAFGDPVVIATGLSAPEVVSPFELDLSSVPAGTTRVRADLQITTAPADGSDGQTIPGTEFAIERTEEEFTVKAPLGFPTVGTFVSLGEVEGPMDSTGALPVTGPGCVWLEAESLQVEASPRDIGQVTLGHGMARTADECIVVPEGAEERIPFTLVSEGEGNGALSGNITVLGGPEEALDRAEPTTVRFTAEMVKRPSGTVRWLVFVLTLLIGIGLPLALLYVLRWRVAVIPARALMSRELDVTVQDGIVLRDGAPLSLTSDDLRNLVSIPAGGGREVAAESLTLRSRSGWNLLAEPHVLVTAPAGPVITSAGDSSNPEKPGLLPLAVHNSWVAWPGATDSSARMVFLLGVDADDATRADLVESVQDRLPEFILDPNFTPAPDQTAAVSLGGDEARSTTNAWVDLDDSVWQPEADHHRAGPTTRPDDSQAASAHDQDRDSLSSSAGRDSGDLGASAATSADDDWDFGGWNDDDAKSD